MSFDFFNNSNLAFGSKLTKVFTILDRLAEDAENNVDQISVLQSQFEQYLHKNYIAPRPISPESPCRTDEILALPNNSNFCIKDLSYDNISGNINISVMIFNKTNNRFTLLDGSSDIKEGFIRYKESVSNTSPQGTLVISEEEEDNRNLITICKYRVDNDGKINLKGDVSSLKLTPCDISQYTGMSKGKTLASNSAKYTSDDYQAVCVVGTNYRLIVNLNGKKIIGNTKDLRHCKRHTIVYLKPKDVITGTYSTIFKINYNS